MSADHTEDEVPEPKPSIVSERRSSPRVFNLGAFAASLLVCTAVAGLLGFGCGTATARLEISAPSRVVVGVPLTITVTAMVLAERDTIFNSGVHFTSSDPAAVLPADYGFLTADAGSHTFTKGVTFMTLGNQTLTATDTIAPSITATATITVSASTAGH